MEGLSKAILWTGIYSIVKFGNIVSVTGDDGNAYKKLVSNLYSLC